MHAGVVCGIESPRSKTANERTRVHIHARLHAHPLARTTTLVEHTRTRTNAIAMFSHHRYWTMNMHAEDGAEDDSYQYNPWRAPGHAPVVDPCGQAGGKYKQTPMGGASMFGTVVVPTAHGNITLTMGDMGSKVLPPSDPSTVPKWKAGSTPRVAWGMRFNHGGTVPHV